MLKKGIWERIRIATMILFAKKKGDIVFKVCGKCGSSKLKILHEFTKDSKDNKELNDLCKESNADYIYKGACQCKICGAIESVWEYWKFDVDGEEAKGESHD